MNSFIGKLSQHERGGGLLELETESRRAGLPPGAGAAMRYSRALREAMRVPKPGPLYAPEWACLILGRARAIMAELLQQGAVLISTDALVCAADADFSGPALMALQSGSAEAAPVRRRKRLVSAEEAVRVGKRINDEVEEEGRTLRETG